MPLSEYEQRVLDEMERQLSSDDPKLVSSLGQPAPRRRGRIAIGVTIAIAGLAALVVGMVVGQIWLSLIGFLTMFTGAYFAMSAPRRPTAAPPSGHPAKERKAGLTQRFEERWDRRHDQG